MPGKDGTGPRGRGRGMGQGAGRGRRGGRRAGSGGAGGNCLCPSCGRSIPHQAGVPCSSMMCPWCAGPMIKE